MDYFIIQSVLEQLFISKSYLLCVHSVTMNMRIQMLIFLRQVFETVDLETRKFVKSNRISNISFIILRSV